MSPIALFGGSRGRVLMGASLLVVLAIGVLNALPHMSEAIWQDEAVTLMFYSAQGVSHPFTHYGSPNNHVGFSALLSAWMAGFPQGVGIVTLRLLPMALFILAIPVAFMVGSRLAGPIAGLASGLAFSASAVAGNFATQLRGYGPSWLPLLLALYFALNKDFGSSPRARTGFALSSLAAIAILPTNLVFASLIAGAAVLAKLLPPRPIPSSTIREVIFLLLVPPAALMLAYAAVLGDLVRLGGVDFSAWTGPELVVEWLRSTLYDIRWLAPVSGAGLLLGLLAWRDPSTTEERRNAWLVSVSLVVGLPAAVLAMPNPPFPRTLVPFLPIWSCALVALGAEAVRAVLDARRRTVALGAVFACGLLVAWLPGPACRADAGRGGAYDYGLCHQYFRDSYHPEQVLEAWGALGSPTLPLVSDYEGFYALRVLGSDAPVVSSKAFRWTRGRPALIVATDIEQFQRVRSEIGAETQPFARLVDTGYFEVFAPVPFPARKSPPESPLQ